MNSYHYLEIQLKFRDEPNQLLPVYIKACLEQSLIRIFGEIGGQTAIDLLKFDEKRRRVIFRVPSEFYVKFRAAITLTGQFQGVPCNFQVLQASPVLLTLIQSHIEF